MSRKKADTTNPPAPTKSKRTTPTKAAPGAPARPKRATTRAPRPPATRAGAPAAGATPDPAPPTAPAPAPGGRMTPPEKGVKVRMYRTGLGDCFLMAFPRPRTTRDPLGAFYLMVDCGVYMGTPEPNNKTRIARIVEDIRAATDGHLDLLAITHEHWDHVSAFHPTQSQEAFQKEIALGKLWMAWTEDLRNPLAKDLHDGRKAARAALTHALAKLQGLTATANPETTDRVRTTLEFFGGPVAQAPEDGPGAAVLGAAKSVQTEEAMEWIRDTYGKDRTEFLHPGDGPLTLDDVPDARIYVLGPPEDPILIKKYNPTGDEVYPKAMAAAIEASFFAAFGVVPKNLHALPDDDDIREARRMSLPFDERLQIKLDDIKEARGEAGKARPPRGEEPEDDPYAFYRQHYLDQEPWRSIDANWLESAGEFALQLDSATNNTSLAFALEVGPPGEGPVVLFPADAQVGNWQSWFGKVQVGKQLLGKDMAWSVAGKSIEAKDLLRRTVLYKVGHHGSHNATLRQQGLELMGPPNGSRELVAFLPVNEHVARKMAHYGEMPLMSLVKDLLIRTDGRLARNDEGETPEGTDSTLLPIPGAPARRTDFLTETELYFEYTVAPPP